jgi:hypothetical protein
MTDDFVVCSGCDNTINTTTLQSKRLPDIACSATACPGDASLACGGPFAMALYQQPTESKEASLRDNPNCRNIIELGPLIPSDGTFSLTAVFKDTPTSAMPINLAVLDPTAVQANGTQVLALIISVILFGLLSRSDGLTRQILHIDRRARRVIFLLFVS